MKERRLYSIISYLLLLSIYDVEPFVGAFLLLGLLAYEVMYDFKSKGTDRSRWQKRTRTNDGPTPPNQSSPVLFCK